MIINVESQRINAIVGVGEPIALLSNKIPSGSYNRGFKPITNFGKSYIQCDYCHFKGHTKENCYKLHGYLINFKGKKGGGDHPHSKVSNAHNANITSRNHSSDSSGSHGITSGVVPSQSPAAGIPSAPFFIQDQYNHIL